MKAKKAAAESFNNQVYNVMLNNLILTCVVLHEYFGFGTKRLDDYIQAVMEEAKHFDDMAHDGVLELKTAIERQRYQQKFKEILRTMTKEFLPEAFYNEMFIGRLPTRSELNTKVKNEDKKLAISVSEAAKMQTMAQAFSDYLKDKEENQNVHIGNDHNSRCLRRPADPAGRTEH
ncbi:MAG: hypothetical protein ACI4JK_05280 [Oscillospiraceae bacterium]